ncbi:MAG: PLDc N-terminal domain-containing protein, partial [Candidatus Methanomethylophilaceae archaeon]
MTYFTKPFFTLVFAIADIYPLVILLDVIGIILILFKEKFEPRTFVLWLMIIIVLPVVGFVMYLL